MRKSSFHLLNCFLIPTALAAALAVQSCSGGEMPSTSGATNSGGDGAGNTVGSTGGGQFFITSGTGGGGAPSSSSTGGSSFGSSSTGGASTSSSGTGGSMIIGGINSGGSAFGGPASGGSGIIVGGGAGGAAVVGPTGSLMATAGGFVTSGAWMGYASPFAGPPMASKGTVTPATFTSGALCAMGMIAPDLSYNSTVGISWNIAQTAAGTAGTVATTGTGLMVNLSATGLTLVVGGGSQLRVQIDNGAGMRWCAPVAASGSMMIPWGSFNTMCYDTTKLGAAAYTVGTPIATVGLVVPSSAGATVGPFNFCLLDAKPY